jgi:hypothetical protein
MFQYMEKTEKGTLLWFAIFDLAGGAVNDVPANATAYAHRDALFYLQSYAVEINPLEKVSPTIKGFLTGLNKVIEDGMREAGEVSFMFFVAINASVLVLVSLSYEAAVGVLVVFPRDVFA